MRLPRRAAAPLLAALLAACSPAAEVAVPTATPAEVAVQPTPEPTAEPTPTPTPEPTEEHADHGDHAAHVTDDEHAGHSAAEHAEHAGMTGEELIAAVAADAPRWADIAAAEAAGYRSIGDAFTGFEHLVHPDQAADPTVLDPTRPESLVYRVEDGEKTYVSAMFILPPGSTMDDVPDLGDERAVWHLHDDLCFDEEGRLAGVFRDGQCLFGGEHRITPPMLHVWVVDHPCGPFAGIEGRHGDGCAHQH
jgi:hypothetical protein